MAASTTAVIAATPSGGALKTIGAIVLIAEHDRVDAARLQILDVREHAFDQLRDAAVRVVERRAGQGADVGHGDHDFRLVAEEVENHGPSSSGARPLDSLRDDVAELREARNLTSRSTLSNKKRFRGFRFS